MTDSPAPASDTGAAPASDSGSDTAPPQTDAATVGSSADVPPDHLSVNPRSAHFHEELLRRGIGIRFKGRERTDIEEYSISEGWVRVQAGKSFDRKGQPLTLKLTGPVEAWFQDLGDDAPVAQKA